MLLALYLGQANYGHYWIYIRDHVGEKWWKYNDTNVTEVNETEIFKDTTGSTANPYFLVYVRSSGKQASDKVYLSLKTMISLLTMYTQISLSTL
jgi:Ubiquitin carboxyl-terminal hydrolase